MVAGLSSDWCVCRINAVLSPSLENNIASVLFSSLNYQALC